ncbi:MAG: LysM peptidoglycan-binding domain-containing protein [Ilumatobacteraceae bacterium]
MRSRLFVAGLAVAGGLALGACGSGSSGTSSGSTILPLTPTNFATIPTVPATTTTTVPPAAGDTLGEQTTYVIQAGDYASTIAQKFKVSLQDLLTLNGWTLQGQYVTNFPAVGTEIKIPAGATMPGAATATATSTASDGGSSTTAAGATTTTAKSGSSKSTTTTTSGATAPTNSAGPCVEGTYTIQKGDIPLTVAKHFDLTVDELNAANASTKGYKAFIVGTKIIIPKGSNCPAT